MKESLGVLRERRINGKMVILKEGFDFPSQPSRISLDFSVPVLETPKMTFLPSWLDHWLTKILFPLFGIDAEGEKRALRSRDKFRLRQCGGRVSGSDPAQRAYLEDLWREVCREEGREYTPLRDI